uniref:SUN domain-containing protein n=1 Tax=Hucho hucho TaxID=62062 RepID=A0A4W5R086_9TELE
TNIYTLSLLKINAVDSERMFLFLLTNAHLTTELKEAMAKWLHENVPQNEPQIVKEIVKDCSPPLADRMPDFALESQGASIVSTRCSETYRTRSACVPLFISFLCCLLPPFIALSHPARITHVTLEHLPVSTAPTGRINSAPKAFSVFVKDGTFLGTFTYDQHGEPIQTFQLVVYRYVELRVLSNWGHLKYTCVYRFRVHGHMAPSST